MLWRVVYSRTSWGRTGVCPASTCSRSRTLVTGDCSVTEDFLGAESWNQADSDKQEEAHVWLVLIMISTVQKYSKIKHTRASRSDERSAEVGATPDSLANGGESDDWRDEIAVWRCCRSIQGWEDWVLYPDWCAWHLSGSYLPSLVTEFSPSCFKQSKSLSGSKIQQNPVSTVKWLRYFLSSHIWRTKISLPV